MIYSKLINNVTLFKNIINQSHLQVCTTLKIVNISEGNEDSKTLENSWFEIFLNNLRAITECLRINYSRDEFPKRLECRVEIGVLRLVSQTF